MVHIAGPVGVHTPRLPDSRDARVPALLADTPAAHRDDAQPYRVAVVYGAGAVRAIAEGLRGRPGYLARAGEWLTVVGK